ncbi:MAG: terminase small subunit [Pseudomonadota bacterium]
MTPKQKAFVDEYLKDPNATEAAKCAGYSQKTAYSIGQRLLKNVEIQKAIEVAQAERSKRTLITADKVLERLEEITDRCMQKEQVMEMVDGKLVPSGEWKFNAAGANKSLELVGKHLGMFKDRIEHSGPDGKPIEINTKALTDEQLEAKIAEHDKRRGK